MNKSDNYVFWTSDPTVLYKNRNYLSFFPSSNMTRVEQFNAITRFCIYLFILLVITKRSMILIQVCILIIVFVTILYYIFESDKKGKYDELNRIQNNKVEGFCNNDIEIEAGFYDYENNLKMGTYEGAKKCKNKMNYSFDEFNEFKKNKCKIPTKDNPFMNPTINDFENYNAPEACNVDDDEIKEKMIDMFNTDLYRDVSDLFERQNSQRMYYTVPYTTVPDQPAFANWLYGNHKNCRNDQTECLRYEDLRYGIVRNK
jgi:hypothetical protein